MRYCSKCGNAVEDGSLFCTNCGNKFNSSQETGIGRNVNSNINYANNQQVQNGQAFMQGSNVPYGGMDKGGEYIILKGSADWIKGTINVVAGRLEMTNKKLQFYGRSSVKTGALYGLLGVFSFLIPVKLVFEIDIKDIVKFGEGEKRGFARTIVFSTKDNDYRFTVYNVDEWLRAFQNAVYMAKNNG